MKRLIKLLGQVWLFPKHISKKAYTKGFVILTAGMVTVMSLGVNGFLGECKATIPIEKVEAQETVDEELETAEMPEGPVMTMTEVHLSGPYRTALKASFSRPKYESFAPIRDESLTKQLVTTTSVEKVTLKDTLLLTEKDYTALVNIVEAEATGEDIIGKIMVANVVLNRVKCENFPDTIYDVVYQKTNGKAQFSPIDDGRMGSLKISDTTYEAVERALAGEDHSNGALFFVAKSLASTKAVSWFENNLTKVATYGVHEFYSY